MTRSKPIVLVADNQDLTRRQAARLLSAHAFVRTACKLEDAERALEEVRPSALVVEIEMADGVLGLIERARRGAIAIPVLVVSSTQNLVLVSRATRVGAAFISKQAGSDTLEACLQELVRQASKREAGRSDLVARVCGRASLTPAEREALCLFAVLGERRMLAAELGIAETSVRSRIRGICRKLGIDRLHQVFQLMLEEAMVA